MPASSEWTQLWTPIALAGQASSLVSLPVHWTLSNQILPAPLVKPVVRATAPGSGKIGSWLTYVLHVFTLRERIIIVLVCICKENCYWISSYQLNQIQVACRPLGHQEHPTSRHTRFPIGCYCRTQHVPHWHCVLQPNGDHPPYKLWRNEECNVV